MPARYGMTVLPDSRAPAAGSLRAGCLHKSVRSCRLVKTEVGKVQLALDSATLHDGSGWPAVKSPRILGCLQVRDARRNDRGGAFGRREDCAPGHPIRLVYPRETAPR